VNGPAFLGSAELFESVAAGEAADLVLLARNPLEGISATRAIRAVVLKGRYLDRRALDTLLAETAAKAGTTVAPK
jgi:hypothetical protein